MRILAAILCLFATTATAQVHVRDADTIVVSGTPVRLSGKTIECDLNGERTHDRWVGICYANGQDIGAAVIAAGHALDCARYSGSRYRHLETPAAKSRLRRAGYC